jgi:hypothetical protein
VWKMVPSCLMWCLWREQNDRNFEDQEKSIEEFKSFFFHCLYSWTTAYLAPLVLSFSDFLVHFSSILKWSFVYFLCVPGLCFLRF